MLQLYDLNKIKVKGLTKYRDVKVEKELSGEEVLSFSYPKNLSESIKEECYIRTKENEYVIKEVSKGDDWTGFVAKVNVETIKGNPFNHYESKEQTCTYAVNLALAGTGWTVGACDVTKRRTVRKANCSSYEILQEIRKVYRCDFRFNAIERKIYIYQSMGSDKGVYFIDQLNLKKLDIQSNSYDFCTRIIPLGKDGLDIKAINSGKEYVENYQYSNKIITKYWEDNRYTVVESLKEDAELKLKELSTPRRAYSADIIDLARVSTKYTNILEYSLGDTITLISKDKKVKEKQRIIKLIEYPDEPEKNSCEIANRTLTLEDLQVDFIESTDTVNSVTTTDGMLDNSKIDFNPIKMEVESLIATKIDVQELNAVEIRVGNLIATKASITEVNAINANLTNLISAKANITDLTAINGKITLLETKVGSIDTILSKEIFVELATAGKIVAGSSIIAEGAIGSAQISSLSATKLSAGIIDAAVITVKNLNADNITVGSINGQRIANGAVDNSKVADNANIAGNKLNINDVIVHINGSTTQINGTKIQVGDRTLDVELSTQKIVLEENKTNISKQQTTINAMDSAIKLKVDNQTFNTFKSTTEGSIGTINTSLNKNTSSIDVLQKSIALKVSQAEIDTLESKVLDPKLLTKLNGMELFNQTYSSDTTSKPFTVGNYDIVPCTELGLIDNKNLVKTMNVAHLKTDFIPYTTDNLYYMSLEAYNKDTTTGILYVGVEFYDKDKISLGSNDLTIYGITARPTDIQVNTWTKLDGYVRTDSSRNKAAFIRLRLLTRYGATGVTYMKGFTLKQLGAYPLSNLDTKIDTKVSEINLTLDGITSRVGKTESASTVIDGKVTALSTRVSNAEQKITPESITTSVRNSTAYQTDLNGKASTTDLQTAQSSIQILSNQIANKVDVNGVISTVTQNAGSIITNFSKTGEVIIKNGNFSIENSTGGKMFWVQGGKINAAALDLYAEADGTMKIYGPGAKGVQLISNNDKEIYIDFKRSGTAPYNGRISMPKANQMQYICDSHYFGGSSAVTTLTVQGQILSETSIYAKERIEGHSFHAHSGYITANKALWFTDPTFSAVQDINVRTAIHHGAKTALVDTKSYGKTFVYAEESTAVRFSDYGEGVIGEDGLCYVHLEQQYMETVTTNNSNYRIQLTSWAGCNAEIQSKHPTYFIVIGNINKKFEWKVIADRKGYENMRFNEAMEANNCVGGI